MTVREVVERYLRYADAESVHCDEAREGRIHVFALFLIRYGECEVTEMKPFHLRDFIAEQPTWKSPGTRRGKAGCIKAAFGWAWREGRIDRHPFPGVHYEESERRPDMPDDVFEKLCLLANKSYERVLRFLRFTGCRIGELCQADWSQMDLERGVWTVEKHKTRKKTKKPKIVVLVDEAVALLKDIRAAAAVAAAPTEPDGAKLVLPIQACAANAPVFLNTQGQRWKTNTLGRQLAHMKERFGIDVRASLHGIRHRYCTTGVANGASAELIGAQIGHTDVRTTQKYYVDLQKEIEALKAAARLAVPRKKAQ